MIHDKDVLAMEPTLRPGWRAGTFVPTTIDNLFQNPLLASAPDLGEAANSTLGHGACIPAATLSTARYRTTARVLQLLMEGDLARARADSIAAALGMSGTTLRRRLRADHTCYQFLLDRVRQYRCERALRAQWRPGKCLADELGYLEVNSFYRAFQRWTGLTYSQYKERYGHRGDSARVSALSPPG